MRFVVLTFLAFILLSLFSALYFLLKDKGNSERTAKALTVRVVLSITLFVLLLLGFHFGFEGVAWYWHFVDVVWLGLFIFVYWL